MLNAQGKVAVCPKDRSAIGVGGDRNIVIATGIGEDGSVDVTSRNNAECLIAEGICSRPKRRPHGLIIEDFADNLSASGAAGELDVEACFAIDDVVAAAALEEVAAATAEQDVATGEGDWTRREVVCQTVDEVDVGEFVEGIGFRIVGALNEVAEGGTAGSFGFDEEVADGIAAQRLRLVDELAPLHVDADAVVLVFPLGPVEAEPPLELVEAAQPEHDVVTAEALHAVTAEPTVEDVIALDEGDLARGCALVADQQVAADAALDP